MSYYEKDLGPLVARASKYSPQAPPDPGNYDLTGYTLVDIEFAHVKTPDGKVLRIISLMAWKCGHEEEYIQVNYDFPPQYKHLNDLSKKARMVTRRERREVSEEEAVLILDDLKCRKLAACGTTAESAVIGTPVVDLYRHQGILITTPDEASIPHDAGTEVRHAH